MLSIIFDEKFNIIRSGKEVFVSKLKDERQMHLNDLEDKIFKYGILPFSLETIL